MALPRGIADKRIVDAINTALEGDGAGLDDAGIAALIADEDSDVHAALVALIAAETA